MDPLAIYAAARDAGLRPALLESLGPPTAFSRRALLAVAPRRRLEVWDGSLYEDGAAIGAADDLLAELETGLSPGRDFPVWVGFFSYEFAARLGLPTGAALPGLPEAAFCLYDDGWLWRDGRLVGEPPTRDPRLEGAAAPLAALPHIATRSDYARDDYIAGVRAVQERIRAGWVYQVNLSHRFSFAADDLDPLAYYARLRATNPSPFMGIVEGRRTGRSCRAAPSACSRATARRSARGPSPARGRGAPRPRPMPPSRPSCAARPRSWPSTSCSSTCCATTSHGSAPPAASRSAKRSPWSATATSCTW